jgi:pyrimidine-nucleoside phosphorylase
MRMTELIDRKKRGLALTPEELRWIVRGCTDGSIPDYQLAAWAMAVCFRGMDETETAVLTEAMADSGDRIDLSALGDTTVDKHSTGGVGDKTTLIIGPIVAAAGGTIAKMSGRGLGFTGGTIDKLESIPGFRTALTTEAFRAQVQRIGLAVAGQTGHLAPADKKLYALRDVTATVDCMPLIASSVMSKKLAAGARSIVLDVKAGRGAFMTDMDGARALAERMVDIGRRCGRRMSALITDMDVPLGRAVGNAPEVAEAVQILRGGGDTDLRNICISLSGEMLALSLHRTPTEGRVLAERALNSGAAMQKMLQWVEAQGGDPRALTHDGLPKAKYIHTVTADRTGIVQTMDARLVGEAAGLLGTARFRAGDPVDPAAGLILRKKPGEKIRPGEPLAELHTNRPDTLAAAEARFRSAMTIGDKAPLARPVVMDIIRENKVP